MLAFKSLSPTALLKQCLNSPQPDDVYYCGIKYIKDDVILNEPPANAPAARYQTIEENIKIFEEDGVEFISVPVPEFADSDPANIVHDFNKVSPGPPPALLTGEPAGQPGAHSLFGPLPLLFLAVLGAAGRDHSQLFVVLF